MNNFEKFYQISGQAIEIFSQSIKKDNENYEKEKKKILNKTKDFSEEEKLNFLMTWQFLIDYAFLCLNKEKVENDVSLNWDNYKPKLFTSSRYMLANTAYSKIPYFKDWLRVVDCKDRYLAEGSNFWIKRVRNSFLHGNFEYDYDHPGEQIVKVFEGSPTSTDIKLNIKRLGLHEFIEDNFHNIEHDEFGISTSYFNFIILMKDRISNRSQLKDLLSDNFFMLTRKMDSDFYYTGNDIINSTTGEKVSRKAKTIKMDFAQGHPILESKEFLNPNATISKISPEYIDDMIWILENKFNIYNNKKQRKAIAQAVEQYVYPMESVNRLLHEFDSYCAGLVCEKNEYKSINFDVSKMAATLYNLGDNIEIAFTILKLCRMMYRLQNKNFEKIDNTLFDCKHYMHVPENNEEEMQKRIDKNKSKISGESLSEEDKDLSATNEAYLVTLRNAMAHGNVEITYIVKENCLIPVFYFTDDFTNKRGERSIVELRTTSLYLNEFLNIMEMATEGETEKLKAILNEELEK